MEVTLNFVDCLVCNVAFCPVTLAPQSEDEKLLDIFCHYFDLSSKDVETVYDERVGFPFCDDCREGTLLSLSRFHDQLTSIQNEINQLVTNVCQSIVNIVSKNTFINAKSNGSKHNQDKDGGNYSKEAIAGIRKSITNRFNPQVSLIRLDFQNLSRQLKTFEENKKNRKTDDKPQISSRRQSRRVRVSKKTLNEDSNESEESTSDVDPSSIVENIKDETFSPSVSCKDEESDIDSSNSSSLAKIQVSRKSKTSKRSKSGSTSDSNSKLDMKAEDEHDGDGPSKSKKSPVKTARVKAGRPRKGFELNEKLIPRKYKCGAGDPKQREYQLQKRLRDKLDPVIEVEPNLFRRKVSGWSFRKEQIDGVEMYVCLAEGCIAKHGHKGGVISHITLQHIIKREKCGKCGYSFGKKEQLDQHTCVAQLLSGTTTRGKTQNFGNGQYIYDEIWPFSEVDVVENGGCNMKCGTCGALEREIGRMQGHIRKTHFDRQKFPCEICHKTFVSNARLRQHQLTHSDVREVICDQCGACFKNQNNLKKHVRSKHEMGGKPFKCDFPNCGRGFTYSDGLSRHRKSAGHPKPTQPRYLIDLIVCPLCGRKFVKEQSYELHRKTCRGKKQFICPICQQQSCSPNALRLHMALKHKDEYMNFPEGRNQNDPTKTADEQIARMRIMNKKGYGRQREKKRAVQVQKRLEKLKQLKKNQPTSTS